MNTRVDVKNGFASQESDFKQKEVGCIVIHSIYYDHSMEMDVEITIYDAKQKQPTDGWGKMIWKGGLQDLIDLINKERSIA